MHTDITDNTVAGAGWRFCDGPCSLGPESARRFGRILARRRFGLRTQQSPGTAQQLGLDDRDLLSETRLLLAGGRNLLFTCPPVLYGWVALKGVSP